MHNSRRNLYEVPAGISTGFCITVSRPKFTNYGRVELKVFCVPLIWGIGGRIIRPNRASDSVNNRVRGLQAGALFILGDE